MRALVLTILLAACAHDPPRDAARTRSVEPPVSSSEAHPSEPEPDPPIPGEPLGSPVSNAPTTSGAADVPGSESVILALRPKFRACYATIKGSGPEIVGMVSCGLRINPRGEVVSVSVTRRDRLPYPLVDCIVKELSSAKFAPLPEPTDAMLQVPVRFRVLGED